MKKIAVFAFAALLAACGPREIIPVAPDYRDATMWVTEDGDPDGTGADVFYVVSTWEVDWTDAKGRTVHYADVWNPEHRDHMAIEINKAAAYMAPGNRFYAPYYRHTTIEAFVTGDEGLIHDRTRLSMKDVCDAFDRFQSQRDQNRPLIIAGFSQGGLAVVELLKHIDDDTYSQLAAAYVMGYKVTDEDLASTKHIKPAEGATDTGVTICYNTVKDEKYVIPVISSTSIAINPVNWCTDATPATLHDSITVTLSPEYHVLVVDGYDGSEYKPYGNFINVGDIHSCEPWLYSECIQENIRVRSQAWREKNDRSRFVPVSEAVPDAILEIRYYSTYNFVGERIDGYLAPTAFLTREAAECLRAVSDDVKQQGYRLKIYDAYRPQCAVDHFVRWAADIPDTLMRCYFYPDVDKSLLFEQEYIMAKSGHTRGSTVDLTLFDMSTEKEVDMGGTFDWFGVESHPDFCGNPETGEYIPIDSPRCLTPEQFANRMILRKAMLRHGFKPLDSEWWHFTLKDEPYPDTYFTFSVSF